MKPTCRSLTILLATVMLLSGSRMNGQATLDSAAMAKKAAAAVVTIQGQTESGQAIAGAGFLVVSNGTIVTSLHLIKDLKSCSVQLANGDIFDSVAVLSTDERRDLAIIKVAGFDLPVIELGNSNQLETGEAVVALGGAPGSATAGKVSGIRQAVGFRLIQIDAASTGASSGGPLLNAKGQAVGVLGFKLRNSESLSFAVPINYARGMMENAPVMSAATRVIPSRPSASVTPVAPNQAAQTAPSQPSARMAPTPEAVASSTRAPLPAAPEYRAPAPQPKARVAPAPEYPAPTAQPSARTAPAPEYVPAAPQPSARASRPAETAPAYDNNPLLVRKIFIASFGNADGAEMLREKIAKRLAQSGMFSVVGKAGDADAVLTGTGVWRNGTVKSFTARLLAGEDRLMWSSDLTTGGWVKSASTIIADKVVKGIVRAVAVDQGVRGK